MRVRLPYRGGTFYHCPECPRRFRISKPGSAGKMRRHWWKHDTPLALFFKGE